MPFLRPLRDTAPDSDRTLNIGAFAWAGAFECGGHAGTAVGVWERDFDAEAAMVPKKLRRHAPPQAYQWLQYSCSIPVADATV